MNDKVKYAQVGDEGSEYDPHDHNHGPISRKQRWIPSVLSFLVGLATMGIIMATYTASVMPKHERARIFPEARNGSDPITNIPNSWTHGDCGNTPEEARALGCKFNIAFHLWLPASCITDADAEDEAAMYKDHNWVFTTESGENITSLERLAQGDSEPLTTTFDWHVTHCMYTWKRLHRILMDPKLELDTYVASYHHTSHCAEMISRYAMGESDETVKIFVKYPKCAK